MIQFYSLMWILAAFCGALGFLRGWNREVIATAGIALSMFILFQLDALLRGTALLFLERDQAALFQIVIFLIIVFMAYRNRSMARDTRRSNRDDRISAGILGALLGVVNGYLIGGALWYFVDINEYPFYPMIMMPTANSPSAEAIQAIPLVIMSGGASGSGDALIIVVVVLFVLVLAVL
ncbi:MAG: CvpA family protein [Phototrophicales bacterium]|nr:CvpA family protein [Phototrophicales bacterium]